MEMSHQMMGYDRAITMFSPDGRLLQVEYARKTIKQGSTAIAMICKEGVVFVVDKRILDSFVLPETIEKIWKIDSHLGATASGIISDARVLVERAQLVAQQHRVTYESPIDVLSIVKDISDINQSTTQNAGLRPFGASILFGGIDVDGPKLYEVDPAGIFFGYLVKVIGEGDGDVEKTLRKGYSYDLSVDDLIKLGITALVKVLDNNFDAKRLDCAYIGTKDKKYTKLSFQEIEKLYKQVK